LHDVQSTKHAGNDINIDTGNSKLMTTNSDQEDLLMLIYLMCYQHRLSSKLILVEHNNKLEKNSSTPTYEATVLGEKGARSSRNGKET
jgi:hypothetical protein